VYLGQYDEALEMMQKALNICELKLGEQHPDTLVSRRNVVAMKRIISESVETGTENQPPSVTSSYYHGERARGDQERYEKALGIKEKNLAFRLEILGEQHLLTAVSYEEKGGILWKLNRFDEALDVMQRALAIRLGILDEKNPLIMKSYTSVGFTLIMLGRNEEALEVLKKNLALCDKVHREPHLDTATAYNHIGSTLCKLQRYEEALEMMNKGLAICEAVLGAQHHTTLAGRRNVEAIRKIISETND
jgi:tetratricopeptide (TPR) repeat protein